MDNNYNPKEYLPTIDAILSVADLEKITVKKIRHALQELFSVDLQPNKKAINDVILNRYYDLVSRRSQENDSEEDRKAEIIKQDEIMAQKLQGEMSSRTPGRRKAAPKRKSSTTNNSGATKPPSKTGFNREMALSSQLQEVIGEEKCSRPRVVKLLWAYIKDRDLQNPQDKRQINCDEKLTALFKKKTVGAFEMNKILTKHIFPLDDKGSKDNEVVSDVSEEE